MTTRRRGRSSSRRSGPRRQTAWFNVASVPAVIAIGGQAILDLLDAADIPDGYAGGLTVLRMILQTVMFPGVASTDVIGAMGVAVMTRDALAAGAVPDPIADLVDWYWLTHYRLLTQVTNEGDRLGPVDIRTKRAIRGEGRTLALVFDNSSSSGGSVGFEFSARLLLQRS